MTKKSDLDAFEQVLSNLKIEVSQSSEGVFTACSSKEPLFCYDAHSVEALDKLVVDTIRSYGRHFYGVDDANVETRCSPVGVSIPVERAKRISTIRPILDRAA